MNPSSPQFESSAEPPSSSEGAALTNEEGSGGTSADEESGARKSTALSRIQALVRLLGDPDEKILTVAWEELERVGSPALPLLRQASRESEDERVRVQSRRFLLEWERRDVFREWVKFCKGERVDLERGSFLIARTEDPHCDVDSYTAILDEYASTLRHRLASARDVDDAVGKVGDFLFREIGFRGDTSDYYRADNSYLSRVIDRKMGIPISLATIFLLVCRRLSLSVYGVGMPRHFLLKYEGASREQFVDPFHGGRILSVHDCVRFLSSIGVPFRDEYLQPVTDQAILIRTLNNLFRSYWDQDDKRRANRIAAMQKLLG